MEHQSNLGTTFTGIRSVLIHYEIKGYAIREAVKKLRQTMRVNNMQFPFTTMNNNIMGVLWRAKNNRPDPIYTTLLSFDIEWLNSIPKGQTPETYPYLKWFWGDRLITAKKPYLYLQSTNAGDEFRSIWEGIEGKQIFNTIDPNDNWYDQYKEDWINRTGHSGLYRIFQSAYHAAKNTFDILGFPIKGQAHWDSEGIVDRIDFKKITPESYDGTKLRFKYPDHTPFDWTGSKNDLENILELERAMIIKSRRYARHEFYLKAYAQSLTSQTTLEQKAKDVIPRVYSAIINSIHDTELLSQPFWKNIKTKGGKKNKKNWR